MKKAAIHVWVISLAAFAGGCASTPAVTSTDNPATITLSNYETVWETTVDVLEEYFDVAYENRYDGTIETQPVIAATILEPWRLDSVGLRQRFEATFQTIRRRAFVWIYPSPSGGFQVVVEVYKEIEDLPRPIGERVVGGALFQSINPIQQEVVDSPITPGKGWISLGRDKALEERIIADLHDALDQYDIESHEIATSFKWSALLERLNPRR